MIFLSRPGEVKEYIVVRHTSGYKLYLFKIVTYEKKLSGIIIIKVYER